LYRRNILEEKNMRNSVFVGAILLGSVAVASTTFAMGGMGGYGGGMPSNMPMTGNRLDDYSMAVRLIHQEKYSDAIPYLDRALANRPHNADILNYLGFTHRMVGEYSTSLGFYQQALKEDPDHKGAHEYLGELYLNLHDLASAQGQLAELTRLCPSGCDELDTLTKSIASYQAANPAPATPASPAAQPTMQSPGGG
jgi:predicted Zn-dependent protease